MIFVIHTTKESTFRKSSVVSGSVHNKRWIMHPSDYERPGLYVIDRCECQSTFTHLEPCKGSYRSIGLPLDTHSGTKR